MLLSSVPIALDPTFGTGGQVLNATSLGVGVATAYNPVSHDVIVAGTSENNAETVPVELQAFSPSGVLDSTFGSGGTTVSSVIGQPALVAAQADGKVLVLSYTDGYQPFVRTYRLSRYTLAGAQDASFGNGGVVVINPSGFEPNLNTNVLTLTNGDIVLAGAAGTGSTTKAALAAFTKAGNLDSSFGVGGIAAGISGGLSNGEVVTTLGMVTLDSSGRFVAVGSTSPTAASPANALAAGLLERFTPAGVLDKSFGASGSTIVPAVTGFFAVMASSSGVIAAYGQTNIYTPAATQFSSRLNHFTANGAVDKTYGPGGQGFVSINTTINGPEQEIFQPDGKLLIAGAIGTGNGAHSAAALARLTTSGALDASFGSGGYANLGTVYSANPQAGGVSLQPDGKILLAQTSAEGISPVGSDLSPTRLNANGTPDTTFGPSGTALTRPIFASGQAIAELPNGQTLVAGQFTVSGLTGLYVRRYNVDGSLDSSFAPGGGYAGQSGYAVVGPTINTPVGSLSAPSAVRLIVDGHGRVLVGDSAVGIIRLTATGAVDTTFGANGTAAISQFGNFLLQPNGQIVASSAGNVIMRLRTSGQADASFGAGGKVNLPFFVIAKAPLAVQADGKLLVGGIRQVQIPYGEGSIVNDDLAVGRLNVNGSLDGTFGSGGVATADFFQFDEGVQGYTDAASATALAVLSNGNIVAGGVTQQETLGSGANEGTIVEFLHNGALNPAFGVGGEVHPFGGVNDFTVTNLFVQNDGRLVLTGSTDQNVGYIRRYSIAGSLTDYVTTPVPTRLLDAAVSSSGKLVVVGSAGWSFGLARYLLQGAVITGKIYNDLNADAVFDGSDKGLANWQVYIDRNNNGVWDQGELIVTTDSTGVYTMVLSPGTYRLREVRQNGWTRTQPAGPWPLGYYDVTVAAGQVITARDFGNHVSTV
ncbi:MAG TPA: hypothetical protein VH370_12065 [Humisphaera sp.]|nr:hypothetical protein [Humisphaera sp.]